MSFIPEQVAIPGYMVGTWRADPFHSEVGFSVRHMMISRSDFGIDLTMPLEAGGVVVGDKISISLEIQAVLQQGSAA
jgi:polyisoprenoid-binding protein YceI